MYPVALDGADKLEKEHGETEHKLALARCLESPHLHTVGQTPHKGCWQHEDRKLHTENSNFKSTLYK